MVPSWVTAVKAAPGSSQPAKAVTIRRWAVLEIGRNSVRPCTIPRTIASAHGLVASPFKAAYVSAKHGVLGLIKTLALEGAEQGILASAVCPGFVRTPLVEGQVADQAKAHGVSEEEVLEQVILAPHAVKRLIEPEEVADVVAFLLGPGGRAFTGAPVTMDLGWTAR